MIGDYHIHTNFSTDSEAIPEDHIQRAMFLGMKEICFTDHVDLDYAPDAEGNEQFKLDANTYFDTMFHLKEKYIGQINIKVGIEMGMAPEFLKQNQAYVASKPWDFVIGSVHQIHGSDPYYASYWEGKTVKDVIMAYYEMMLRNVTDNNDYDVIGHFDYIRRYVPDKSYVYVDRDFYDITDMILKNVVAKGHGFELNTRGLHQGVTEFIPTITLLRRYKELGGEIVTIGSDAHNTESLGYAFKSATEILENTGFRYITSFNHRIPSFKPIRSL